MNRRHTMQKSTRNSSTSFATSCIRQSEKLPQKRNLLRMNLATLGVTGTCCVVSVLIDRSMDCCDSTRPMSSIHCSDQKTLNELTKITFTCFTRVDFAYSELYLRNNSFALAPWQTFLGTQCKKTKSVLSFLNTMHNNEDFIIIIIIIILLLSLLLLLLLLLL